MSDHPARPVHTGAVLAVLEEEVAAWPGTAGAAVVVDGAVVARSGSAETHRWASVTKLLTAITVLDAADRGLLDLDEPAGPAGSTVRHLLAHASGLAVDDDRSLAAPGRRRIYSNRGVEHAAALLAERTDGTWADAVRRAVLEPLGMRGTRLQGSAAHGASGPLDDLARLAGELQRPTVLDPRLVTTATTPTWPDLAGVLPGFGRQDPNPWGLGPELRGTKHPHWTGPDVSPRTFGHFGQSGSFLWVDPDAGVACVGLGSEPFGPWAAELWPRLTSRVLRALPAPP